jgi:hypothetical protein
MFLFMSILNHATWYRMASIHITKNIDPEQIYLLVLDELV